MIEIEFDEPEVALCECCGHQNRRLFRTIREGEEIKAVYLTTLPSHSGFPLIFTVVWGNFADDATKDEKLAARFQVVDVGHGYATGIVDADDSEIAVGLSKDDAKEKYDKYLYSISDLILQEDKLVLEYLESGPPAGHA